MVDSRVAVRQRARVGAAWQLAFVDSARDTVAHVVAWLAAGSQAMPSLPITDLGALPIGTAEQLLRRRPDLVQAARQLAAATANIGVATADLFPRVSLSGLIGLAGVHLGALGENASQQYAFGAGLSWPLLDFGGVRSRIAASKARAEQALPSYEQSVSLALEERRELWRSSPATRNRTSVSPPLLAMPRRGVQEVVRICLTKSVDLVSPRRERWRGAWACAFRNAATMARRRPMG